MIDGQKIRSCQEKQIDIKEVGEKIKSIQFGGRNAINRSELDMKICDMIVQLPYIAPDVCL